MTIHIGTAMVRRRVIADDASRNGRSVDVSFQQEAIRGARWIATVLLIAFTAWALVAIVWSL